MIIFFFALAQFKNPAIITPNFSSGVNFFQTLLPGIIGALIVIGAIIFVLTLIIGSIQWITAGGDKAQIEAARGRVTNALIGITIVFGIFALFNLVGCFFGIDLMRINVGQLSFSFNQGSLCRNQ